MEAVVFEAALLGFPKGWNCFCDVTGEKETAAKHEDDAGRIFLSGVSLDGRSEGIGGAVILIMGCKPCAKVGVVIGGGRVLQAVFEFGGWRAVGGGENAGREKQDDGKGDDDNSVSKVADVIPLKFPARLRRATGGLWTSLRMTAVSRCER